MISLVVTIALHAAPECAPAGPACTAPSAADAVQSAGAPGAPDTLGRGHWLVDEENDEVLLIHGDDRVERFVVGKWPEQLVLTRDGRAFVSCRETGQLAVIDTTGPVRLAGVGTEPRALALDEVRRRLYVGLVTAREVLALDLDTLAPVARASLPFEPTTLALSGDTVVAGGRKSATLALLEADTLRLRWNVDVPARDKIAAQVEVVAGLGRDVLIAARLIDSGLTQTPLPNEGGGYGGVRVNQPFEVMLFVLRSAGDTYEVPERLATTTLPEVTAAAVTKDRLFLSSRGTRRVIAVRANGLHSPVSIAALAGPPAAVALSVEESGAMAVLDAHRRRAVVSSNFGAGPRDVEIPMSRLDPEVRRGRELFHAVGDRRLSARSMGCVSCHPDGREDGLVWRLQGTSRQTPMLAAGRLEGTAPYNWLGTAKTLDENLVQTVEHRLMGTGLEDFELQALSRYVREGLRPVRVPPPSEPARVARGRELFADASVGCATCHPADLQLTDGLKHDVQSLSPLEQPDKPRRIQRPGGKSVPNPELLGGEYDTPSLIGLAVTAPYFHDGSAATLEDVLLQNHDRMGTTSHLTAEERAALIAYLSAL